MRGKILRCLTHATPAGLVTAFVLVAVPSPIGAFADDPPIPGGEQKQTDQVRCEFLMGNINATILSLNTAGEVTFLNRYGQNFFGYSSDEILGKPMLGTLTPLTGFEGRDLTTFMAGVVHHPNRYAFSVNTNILHDGKRVQTFWANKGISDDQGNVPKFLESAWILRTGNFALRTLRKSSGALARCWTDGIGFNGANLERSTNRIETISEELEKPWKESDTGDYESVPPK